MAALKACFVCGKRSDQERCPKHRLDPRPRGNAFEPTRQEVAERYGWVCQLCHEPIDPSLKRPHPKALQIHHDIARARGGPDHESNYVPAHADCNQRKGAS